MRSGVLAVVVAWSQVAVAQPAPAPQPVPYPQPAPAPAPQPAPYPQQPSTYPGPPLTNYPGSPPPPPPPESKLTWSFGIGLATLAYDDMDGPCPSCDHGNVAAGLQFSAGVRMLPGISPFAMLDVGVTTASGLGSDGDGSSQRLQQVAIYGGVAIELGAKLQVFGGLGYSKLSYSWEETTDNFLFGSSTSNFDMDVGSGPAALAGARLPLGIWGKLRYGLEGRLTAIKLKDAGEASQLSVGFVAGWL